MPNFPSRHFLSWARPLLPQAVEFLAAGWDGPRSLDLSRILVVVPTRHAGRRLRQALAEYAAERGSAVFAPRVHTPESLVAAARQVSAVGGLTSASRLVNRLAWLDLLSDIDLADFRDVFPVDPPERNFAWALGLADQLVRLQTSLAENDLQMADVAGRVGTGFAEAPRWRQLAALEQRQHERLARASARSPFTPGTDVPEFAATDRVVVVGTADPLPAALAVLAGGTAPPVDVLVFAPPECADDFDEWGRPIPAAWTRRVLTLPDFETRVHLCADPAEQATRAVRLAHEYRARVSDTEHAPAALALGIVDAEIAPQLVAEAARTQLPVFDPEGARQSAGALYHLLVALSAFSRSDAFEHVTAVARCPHVLAYLARRRGDFSPAKFLIGLDELHARHLPADLRSALRHASGALAEDLSAFVALRQAMNGSRFPDNIASVLTQLFRGKMLNPADAADVQLQEAAAAWTDVVRECGDARVLFPSIADPDWLELALRTFADARIAEEKAPGAFEMQGWLELLFEEAPHLVVAGFNDGAVPDAVTEDAFLPDSLRAKLGLKTNDRRFARDAYMLEALAVSRGERGRLDLLYGKTSSAGDPLRPSRLLVRCRDEELPGRIAFLFRPAAPVGTQVPWARSWQLRVPRLAPPRQVAVTALRRWLACRFRFYLQYALRMQAVDAEKTEMDAFDFGSLCHSALESMGRDPGVRDCTDATVLRGFLLKQLEMQASAKFGQNLSLPLMIQIESARQRLSKLADVQARERAEGWVTEFVERPFSVELAGVTVRGKIDRIDRNANTGAIRVIDYKTSDTAVSPRAAHLRTVQRDEVLPEWATVVVDGRLRAWADLQLPLYRHALAAEFGADVRCGYINLPKATSETALCWWDDYTPELQERAMVCAQAVCEAIAAGEFWPPTEGVRPEGDDFASLFHDGAAASIEWKGETE